MGNIYVGDANNIARKVKGIYVGDANGIAKKVLKGYVGDANGIAQEFYSSGFPVIRRNFSYHITDSWSSTPQEQIMTMQEIADMQALGAVKLNAVCVADFVSSKVYPILEALAVMASNNIRPNSGSANPYVIARDYESIYPIQYYTPNVARQFTISGNRLLSASYIGGVNLYLGQRDDSSSQYGAPDVQVSGYYEITFE